MNYPDQLADRSAINICALNATKISSITFENIRLEKGKRLIGIDIADDFWFGSLKGNWSWQESISDIHYKNIESHSDGSNVIRLYGKDSNHLISGVTSGNITITGDVRKSDVGGGDGVNVSIWKNNTMIWPLNGSWQTIEYNNSTGYSHSIKTSVEKRDVISFRVDQRGNNAYDSTNWDPTISLD